MRHAVALESTSDTLFWDSYHALDYALVGFKNSLPPLSSLPFSSQGAEPHPGSGGGTGPGAGDSATAWTYEAEELGHTLLFAHVASLTAVMHVHDIFASRDESERWIVVRAARDVAALIHEAAGHPGMGIPGEGVLDPRKTHMLIGVSPPSHMAV